jgi:hypothetical protein
MTTLSVLEVDYAEPQRPYSQLELSNMRQRLFRQLRLGKVKARHEKCGHHYLTKENGRKEKDITDQNSSDCGNCSVCWKINKTPKNLKNKAQNLVYEYSKIFYEDPTYLTYEDVDLENAFYKWLLLEFMN